MPYWPHDLLMLERSFTPEEAATNEWQTEGMREEHVQRAIWQRHRSNATAMMPNYTPTAWHECDMFVLLKSGYTVEYEIKCSHADFKADFRKRHKHGCLRARNGSGMPTRFFYVVPAMLVSPRDVPDYAGLFYCTWTRKERWQRLFAPCITVIRQAPRLSHERHESPAEGKAARIAQHMRYSAYWRFWSERFRFEEYRRQINSQQSPRPECDHP